MANKTPHLFFGGSVWCNMDIALRSVDQLFRYMIRPRGLTVIEWHILRALYNQDGQHASTLARAVGRAATSFTPNLDKLQDKGFIQRKPDKMDRRAVRIYLTETGEHYRADVLESSRQLDKMVEELVTGSEFASFQKVLATLQSVVPEEFGAE
jgi:DNA-binding MarR family transcriptional regulator